jgi:hypothetical protein
MQVNNFIKYMEQPASLSEISESELTILLKEFPYCQTGQLMSAIQLKGKNSILFDQQLKKVAAYCTDRNQLFNLLNTKQESIAPLLEDEVVPDLKPNPIDSIVENKELKKEVDKGKETSSKELDTLEKEYLSAAISSSIFLETEVSINKVEKDSLPEKVEEVVLFDENKGHSFSSWLKHYNGEEIIEDESKNVLNKEVKQDLIDRFIQEDPKIQPKKTEFYSPTNMARLSVVDESDIVSETLALIYVDQGDYKKAIDAYKKLSLKNPEKRSYFASQIKILNQKIK